MDVLTPPYVVPGYEPGPDGAGKSEQERKEILWNMKQMRLVQAGVESPVAKAALSGAMGKPFCFVLGDLHAVADRRTMTQALAWALSFRS